MWDLFHASCSVEAQPIYNFHLNHCACCCKLPCSQTSGHFLSSLQALMGGCLSKRPIPGYNCPIAHTFSDGSPSSRSPPILLASAVPIRLPCLRFALPKLAISDNSGLHYLFRNFQSAFSASIGTRATVNDGSLTSPVDGEVRFCSATLWRRGYYGANCRNTMTMKRWTNRTSYE